MYILFQNRNHDGMSKKYVEQQIAEVLGPNNHNTSAVATVNDGFETKPSSHSREETSAAQVTPEAAYKHELRALVHIFCFE